MRETGHLNEEGMTMIEMVVVLGIIAVLAAILTPIVSNYIDQSRLVRAQSDVRVIGEAISRFESDMGRYPMFSSGSGNLPDSAADVVRLGGHPPRHEGGRVEPHGLLDDSAGHNQL